MRFDHDGLGLTWLPCGGFGVVASVWRLGRDGVQAIPNKYRQDNFAIYSASLRPGSIGEQIGEFQPT